MAIVEVTPDIFYIATSPVIEYHAAILAGHADTPRESSLHRLNLRDWTAGQAVKPETVLQLPEAARGLNGGCVIAPNVVLIADCFASLIWRVDIPAGNGKPAARIWLKHNSMANDPDGPMPDQPGINSVQYAQKLTTSTTPTQPKELFMRVAVDPATHDPAGEPEFVGGGMMGDDFCIDDNAGVAYIATHRQNTIDRVSLNPSANSYRRHSVAGNPSRCS